MNKKRTATSIGLGLLLAFVAIPAFPFQSIKQFEETSYYLKDVNFISEKVGWAVGEPHWDQARKGYTGTIIKTVDGGGTWVAQAAGTSQALRGVKFVDANNGWAVGVNGTILHTSDGGKRWVKQPVATTDEFRGVVFVNATQGWATSVRPIHYDWRGNPDNWRGSIWHTVNGGTTWYLQAVSSNASILNRIEFIDAKKGWAVGVKYTGNDQWGHPKHQPVVYHTRNGGLSWPEQFSPALAITLTGVDFVDANNGWAVGFKTRSDLAGGTVFHTTNGGTTWTRQNPSDTLWDVHFLDKNRGYTVGFDYIAAWGPPVYRTLDGGVTWKKVHMDKWGGEEGLFGVAIAGNRVIGVGDHDYICLSTNAWGNYGWPHGDNLFSQKYINVHYRFEDVFFVNENRGWAVGTRSFEPDFWGQVIFNTQDGGVNWRTQYERAPPFDHLFSYFRLDSVHFTDSRQGWAVGCSEDLHGSILHTMDGGTNWTEQGRELYASWDLEFFATQFLDSRNGWALAADRFPSNHIFLAHTTNAGTRWEWVDTGVTGSLAIGYALVQGDLAFTDAQHGWAVGGLGNVVHTKNGGKTWTKQVLTCGWPTCPINLFAVDFINNQVGWIAGEGLYHTTNGGARWVKQDVGVSSWFQDLQFTDSLNGWLAGTTGVLMRTSNRGATWNMVNSGASFTFRGISFINSRNGWAVGDGGTIVKIFAPTAAFVGTNRITQGNWKGVYGADGYNVINNSTSYPRYAQVTPSGHRPGIWAASTSDRRALQKAAAGSTDRIAAYWYSATNFSLDLNLRDGATHRVALYCLDWTRQGRAQRIEILDATSGARLDNRTVNGFGNGIYLVWDIRGHVKVRVTKTAGPNAVLSGLFFSPRPTGAGMAACAFDTRGAVPEVNTTKGP